MSQITQWKVYTMEDAYEERPPIRYAVHGMIAVPSLNIFYGAPGSYKSMLLADMILCISMGISWPYYSGEDEDCFGRVTEKMQVLWVDFDNGTRTTLDRFKALGKFYNIPEKGNVNIVTMPREGLDMTDVKSVERLREVMPREGLVVIDNLSLVLGGINENDPKMARVMGNFRWLVEEYQTSITLIHHQKKIGDSNGYRLGESLRGHSSIEASLDLAMLITAKNEENMASVIPTKLRNVKYIEPFSMEFYNDYNKRGQEVFHFESVPSDEIEILIKKEIVNYLNETKEGGANQTEIMKNCSKNKKGWKETNIRDAVIKMADRGILVVEIREHGSKFYMPSAVELEFEQDLDTLRQIQELVNKKGK